jgi:hypothetical protein
MTRRCCDDSSAESTAARCADQLPSGDRQVCYCFDETEASIRREIVETGRSTAVQRIREHIAADRCACDVRNPRGVCCLGDVIATVRRIAAAVGP